MKYILLSLLFFVVLQFKAQDKIDGNHSCGTDVLHKQKMATDAGYAKRMHDFDAGVGNPLMRNAQTRATNIIPVVVHIMHKGEAMGTGTNITDEQVRLQIKHINENYRKIAGTDGDGDGVDMDIEFALAVRDPDGNCTTGITRTDMSDVALYMSYGVAFMSTDYGISDTALKALDYWDTTQYYNIWIVSQFDGSVENSIIQVAGYAYYAAAHGLPDDGAVIVSRYFINNATTTTHELGHAFNLYHTFEGDNGGSSCPADIYGCGDGSGDCCNDTASHKRFTDCNTTTAVNSCEPNNPDLSYKHNYLTYTTGPVSNCLNMFTFDQQYRVYYAAISARSSFLAANGNMSLVPPDSYSAGINISNSVVCTGTTVNLRDESGCIPNTYLNDSEWDNISFTWTVTNGTNTYNYTTQNANFTPATAGVYDVSHTVTVNGTTFTTAREGAIIVSDGIAATTCIPNYGQTGNFSLVVSNVQLNTINNTTSITVNGYENFACGASTTLRAGNAYTLSVSVKAGNTYSENFKAYIDYNSNGIFEADEFVMQGTVQPHEVNTFTQNITVPLNAVQNTLLTMRVIGEAGNMVSAGQVACTSPFFVGDIEDYGIYITNALGTENFSDIADVILSPNPATTAFTITATTAIDNVTIYNVLGQIVLQKQLYATQSSIDVSALSAGTYTVHTMAQGKTTILKLIKK